MPIQLDVAAGALGAAVSAAMYYAAGVPSSQVFGPSLVCAPGSRAVALTFDDGPSESTPAVLDALAEAGAKATFFQIGANAVRLPELARRVAREGHEIASHTETHPRFYLCSPSGIAREIEQGQRSLETVHGVAPRLFRPPYGARWFGMYPAINRLGLRVVMWSVSSRDWEPRAPSRRTSRLTSPLDSRAPSRRTSPLDSRAPSRRTSPLDSGAPPIATQVIEHTRPGDVVLMHDGDTTTSGDRRQETARALRAILAALGARGLRAVTVSELFGLTP